MDLGGGRGATAAQKAQLADLAARLPAEEAAHLSPTAVKTAAYTAAAWDFVPVDVSAGSVTITLPTAPADKTQVAVKAVALTAPNTVTVNCGGTDVFNKAGGSTSATLSLLAQALWLQYRASGGIWYVVADDLALSQLDARYPTRARMDAVESSGGPAKLGDANAFTAKQAVGAASPTVDGITSRLLVKPSANDENAITVKRPNATWGVAQPYGTGQAFELLKDAALSTDIGYTGTSDDLVLLRIARDGALGMTGNFHLATGLRQPQGYGSGGGYAMFIQPPIDVTHIIMQGVSGQAQSLVKAIDSAGSERFKLLPSGNGRFGMVANAGGLVAGDLGGGGSNYFGIAHADNVSTSNYALMQGSLGDTLINAATGQTVTFRINNTAIMTVAATAVTVAQEWGHTGSKLGFFSATRATKPTVSGSRGGNAALASLITALSTLGLVTDSSTA